MADTIYVGFDDPEMAKKAMGALLDHGIKDADISLVLSEKNHHDRFEFKDDEAARKGITTTTAADAASGAMTGGGIGTLVGALSALAALFIPGFGIVIGGGALATAVASAIGTAAAGAIAGGVTGYLKDQGVPEAVAQQYEETLGGGGALMTVRLPSGDVTRATVDEVLAKYAAKNVRSYMS